MPRLTCRRCDFCASFRAFIARLTRISRLSQIELKAEDLYDKEKVDLETVVMEDVFTLLEATEEGLTEAEVERRIGLFGPNRLEAKEVNPILQVCSPPELLLPRFH